VRAVAGAEVILRLTASSTVMWSALVVRRLVCAVRSCWAAGLAVVSIVAVGSEAAFV